MICLLTPDRVLKLFEADSFMDAQGGGMSLLKEFLVQPMVGLVNINEINTCMLAQAI
jgi:hypothetical protein